MLLLTPTVLSFSSNAPCYKNYDLPWPTLRNTYIQVGGTWLAELAALVVGWVFVYRKFKLNALHLYSDWLAQHPRIFIGVFAVGVHVLMDLYIALVSLRFEFSD